MHIEETLMKLNVCLFLKKDDELLEKYIEIWENVKNWIKIIDSEPVYNEKCLKQKEKLQKEAHERYHNLSEEEKEKKCQYHHQRNNNLSEEQKQNQVESMRNYNLVHRK